MDYQNVAEVLNGMISARLFEEEQQYMSPGLQEVAQLSQLVIREGSGRRLVDTDGKRYLDFMAGVAVCSLGHSHPRYIAALKEQLEKVTVGSFTTENRVLLLRMIASLTPPGLDRIQLYSGGAEAVEASIRLAKSYTKKFEVLGFGADFTAKQGGFSGLWGIPLSNTGESSIRVSIWLLTRIAIVAPSK